MEGLYQFEAFRRPTLNSRPQDSHLPTIRLGNCLRQVEGHRRAQGLHGRNCLETLNFALTQPADSSRRARRTPQHVTEPRNTTVG